jgi:hypothetical protein
MPRETIKELKQQLDVLKYENEALKNQNPITISEYTLAKYALDMGGSIRYPRGGSEGAGFGDTIIDSDRAYAVLREPIAGRVTIVVANDVFDKWFTVDDPSTKAPDPDLDTKVQDVLRKLQAKSILSEALGFERIYGYSLIVGAFDDAKKTTELIKPLKQGAELVDMAVYSKPMVTSIDRDKDPESMRFGLPDFYNVNRGSSKRLRVHYSRVIHLQTSPTATSILDPIWDDLTNGRNIRWGMGQTMFRYGSGFPVLTLNGKSIEQLQAYAEAGYFANLLSRTQLLKNEEMDIEFKGMAGSALNPQPYYQPILENISVGTGIPEPILRGVQAGALTGSETNLQEYYKVISSIAGKVEPFVRQLIDWIMPQAISGGGDAEVKTQPYEVNWAPGYQPSEKDQRTTELIEEQIKSLKLQYMMVDELREEEGLGPLPDGKGAVCLGLLKATPQAGPNPNATAATKPEELNPGEVPKALADQDPREHPTLVATLQDLTAQVHEKKISKANALERGGKVIKLFVNQEVERAKAYVGAKSRRVVTTLPYEQQRLFDEMLRQYLRDFEAIIEDAYKAT